MKLPHNSEEIRSFIAIELSEEVKKGLARLRADLGEHSFVKWVAPEGIHLTLKFLGNILPKQVMRITQAMEEAGRGISPFRLEISGLGAFPNLKQPRVLWVGIEGEIDKLSRLQENIDSALAPLGFAKEEHAFVPHLTLARIRQEASPAQRRNLGELVESINFELRYSLNVESINLMKSQLTPKGAIYTCLFVVELQIQRT